MVNNYFTLLDKDVDEDIIRQADTSELPLLEINQQQIVIEPSMQIESEYQEQLLQIQCAQVEAIQMPNETANIQITEDARTNIPGPDLSTLPTTTIAEQISDQTLINERQM